MKIRTVILGGIALFAIAVSLINASWLAPEPAGKLMLVAHRGIAQQFPREGLRDDSCTATRIRPREHMFIENTLASMHGALRFGADVVELDVHPTADGRMVAFHDWTLDCRTNGTGLVREQRFARLKRLDIGYGYTSDGGKTFPLRGLGIRAIPSVEEVLASLPDTPLIFDLKGTDPADADVLLAAFKRAEAPVDTRYSFYGHPAVTARIKQLAPNATVFGKEQMRACLVDYLKIGWTSHVPASCRNTIVAVPLNYQWAVWGWPNRFLDRMAKVNSKVVLFGDYKDGVIAGIERPEQLAEVPKDFRGYLWVEDIYNIGPALRH